MGNVLVLGAGIVGLCSAFRLMDDGWRVTVLDPRAPGTGCSAGNPGSLSVSSIFPAAAPGVAAKVPGWLLDRDGPLSIRPARLPRLAPWLLQFLRAATAERHRRSAGALYALTRHAPGRWEALLQSAGLSRMLSRDGNLIVYRSQGQYDAETASWQQRAQMGMTIETLRADELRASVPALSPEYILARRVRDNARLSDPLAVCEALAAVLRARGALFRTGEARSIRIAADGAPVVLTGEGEIAADRVVLAAGARSARLARDAGDRIPLEPERGYSVSWDDGGFSLPATVFSPAEKIMAAPVGAGLRFAGTAEFAGFSAPPDWRRADGLVRLGRRMFPDLTQAAPRRWAGLRPATPDGLPVIGAARRSARVIHAFGHGHLGVTNAALTGEIVAALAAGRAPQVDLAPCAPARF